MRRKRQNYSDSSRGVFRSVRHFHRESIASGYSAFYLTPHKKQMNLGRPRAIGSASAVGALIRYIVQQLPDLFIFEISDLLYDILQEKFSSFSIRSYLNSRGYRIAVGQKVVPQSSRAIRAMWASGFNRACSSQEQLIFIDETSHGRWTGFRRKGRSPKGTRVNFKFHFPLCQSKCLFGAFDARGVFSYAISLERPKSDTFVRFLKACVVPHLNPYPLNPSIVIIDNAPTHNVSEIDEIISSVGAKLFCLPAYSPDLNPIENWFHSYKAYWRRNRHLKMTPDDISKAVTSINNACDWSKTIRHTYQSSSNGVVVKLRNPN